MPGFLYFPRLFSRSDSEVHNTASERITMRLSTADRLRCPDGGLRDDRSREFTLKLSGISRGGRWEGPCQVPFGMAAEA